jgi:ribosomal protein L5
MLPCASCTTARGIKIAPYTESNVLREQSAIGIKLDMSTDTAWNLLKRLCQLTRLTRV